MPSVSNLNSFVSVYMAQGLNTCAVREALM